MCNDKILKMLILKFKYYAAKYWDVFYHEEHSLETFESELNISFIVSKMEKLRNIQTEWFSDFPWI